MRKLFASLFIMGLSLSATAQGEAKYRKIDSLLTHFNRNNKFMGAVCIREQGRVVFDKAYGFADVETKTAAASDTRYKIGSVTKMFTATIIFQLVEEKKLKLETKLSEFYPKIKNAGKITIDDLLSHRSGIHNYTDDPEFSSYNTKLINKRDMLRKLEEMTPDFEPGTKAAYSNSNYLLLGYIINDITQNTYKENVGARIAIKLGMKNTGYFGKLNPKKKEATSYTYDGVKWTRTPEWHESSAGAAVALQSNGADLTLFIKALFDGRLITKESLDKMLQLEDGYGKGILTFPFVERKLYGHNGGIESFKSALAYYPKDDMAISLLVNGNNYDYNAILTGVLSVYYKLPFIFPDFRSVKLEDDTLKRFEGVYSTPSLPFKVDITLKDGVLIAHATDQGSFPLNPIGENVFNFPAAGITMTFTDKGFTLKQSDGTTSQFIKEK